MARFRILMSRLVAWAMVALAAHSVVSFVLWIGMLLAWVAIGGSYESRWLQIGIISSLVLPLLTDYQVARFVMESGPLKRLMKRIENSIGNEN